MKEYLWEDGVLIEEVEHVMSWESLRSWRNGALEQSDWRFYSDQSPSQEWIDYRTFLRDLPQNYPSPTANDAWAALQEYDKPEGAE